MELGSNLTLIRRIRGEGISAKGNTWALEAASVGALERELDALVTEADLSAWKADFQATRIQLAQTAEMAGDLRESQFQLLWNVAQVWIAALVLFPLPLLFMGWDELFDRYIPHGLAGLASAATASFLRQWWRARPALSSVLDLQREQELTLLGLEEQIGRYPLLVIGEKQTAALVQADLEGFVTLVGRFSPARNIAVIASGEPGRMLARRLVESGAAESTEGDVLAVIRA